MAREKDAIDALDSTQQTLFAASSGSILRFRSNGPPAEVLTSCAGRVFAMAAQRGGGSLAWIDEKGLRIWADDAEVALDTAIGAEMSAHVASALAWSPCGRWLGLATGRRELMLFRLEAHRVARTIRLPDYPAAVEALSWNAGGDLLATSGAFRIATWDVRRLHAEPETAPLTLQTGRPGFIAVSAIAFHPQRPLVAAGYQNGCVVISQVGRSDELVLRDPCPGYVSTMCWSGNGDHLVFGTTAGEAYIATFPPAFFK